MDRKDPGSKDDPGDRDDPAGRDDSGDKADDGDRGDAGDTDGPDDTDGAGDDFDINVAEDGFGEREIRFDGELRDFGGGGEGGNWGESRLDEENVKDFPMDSRFCIWR